jgi:hypothetical protein
MKIHTLRGIALAAIAGLALSVRGQTSDQSQYPVIVQQPIDQCLPVGSSATFTVVATNATTYQWYKNNVSLDGQTNSSLTLPNVSTSDVAYYAASVINGSEVVPTRSACLNVYVTSGSGSTTTSSAPSGGKFSTMSMMSTMDDSGPPTITVFGAPVVSSGGSAGCPGYYSGYVNYIKPITQGWGFCTDTNYTVHTATDGNATNTHVIYTGYYGDGSCALTTVQVPDPTYSPKYRFSIYFPRGTQVPTNAYPITLAGFLP